VPCRAPRVEVSDLERLAAFRAELYSVFGNWADALFEVVDALTGTARPIRSVAELMFEPVCRRGWGSLYQALEDGEVIVEQARDVLARHVRPAGGVLMFAIDGSKYPRPDTRRVPDVGMQYDAKRDYPGATSPAVPGWMFQWVAQVGLGLGGQDPSAGPAGSWTMPMDVRRVPTCGNANEIAAGQIGDLLGRLEEAGPDPQGGPPAGQAPPLFVLDIGYCPIYLTQRLAAERVQILVRLRSDRVFFGATPPRVPGKGGAPKKHGPRFALDEPGTWGEPDEQVRIACPDGSRVVTRAWHRKHPEPRPRRKWEGVGIVEGTLIRREQTSADGHVQTWWLWWSGPAGSFDLALLSGAYPHRFTIEHMFRFAKQDLSWTMHTPLEPAQATRWSWLVALAYAQLHLARPLAVDRRLPWEKPCPADRLSPGRVRRAFRLLTADLHSPARSPKPGTPGPGRPKGRPNMVTRPRHPVIKKGRPDNTGHPKGKSPRARATAETSQP
jgi:hypothetical protein